MDEETINTLKEMGLTESEIFGFDDTRVSNHLKYSQKLSEDTVTLIDEINEKFFNGEITLEESNDEVEKIYQDYLKKREKLKYL